jgi:hypothetical protein
MSSANLHQTPPTTEEIAVCAYYLWEKEGRPHGRHLIHWLQVEEQLLADYAQDVGLLTPTAVTPSGVGKLHRKLQRKLHRRANLLRAG